MGVNNYQTILGIELNDQMCYSEHHLMVPEHFTAGLQVPLMTCCFCLEWEHGNHYEECFGIEG